MPGYTDLIVFDDMNFGPGTAEQPGLNLSAEQMIALLDYEVETAIKTRPQNRGDDAVCRSWCKEGQKGTCNRRWSSAHPLEQRRLVSVSGVQTSWGLITPNGNMARELQLRRVLIEPGGSWQCEDCEPGDQSPWYM